MNLQAIEYQDYKQATHLLSHVSTTLDGKFELILNKVCKPCLSDRIALRHFRHFSTLV
jgi:hypothetical protein